MAGKFRLIPLLLALAAALAVGGCGKIKGPRFWWDDRNQERLSEDYQLPSDVSAPSEAGEAGGGPEVSDQDLDIFNTNVDRVEEKRQIEEKGVNF